MTKIDVNALKQLSNIELFLMLCGAITVPSAFLPDGSRRKTNASMI